ncbi:MAG TPA: hypothetical protein VHX43_19565 [Xanthobacteraceae bacterium]|jgi:hypothetical protein|nr:hypothetical protein [Xanthobacteraceae bacterium]
MSRSLSHFALRVARHASRRGSRFVLLLLALTGFGLALAGCSKCDVPNLLPHQAGPQSCHDGPDPQS